MAEGARTPNEGDMAQFRVFARQAADMALSDFITKHPETKEQPLRPEIPAPLKWAAGIIAAIFSMGIGAMAVWLVTTVSEMQVTLARMDERMALQANSQDGRFDEIDRRVGQLESYHRNGDSQ